MPIRDGRELARQFERLVSDDGLRNVAEARRSAVAHCLAGALAVRMLRRYREEKARAFVEERPPASPPRVASAGSGGLP
jgi:hypothetical protein